MKKIYVSPKAEVVCYSTPDITSVGGLSAITGTQTFNAAGDTINNDGVAKFNKLHQ